MNISSISHNWYSTFIEKLPALTYQQKIISSIALLALATLGAAYAVYRNCFKAQKDEYAELPFKQKSEKISKNTEKYALPDKNLEIKGKEKPALSLPPTTKIHSVPIWNIPSDEPINEKHQAKINLRIKKQQEESNKSKLDMLYQLVVILEKINKSFIRDGYFISREKSFQANKKEFLPQGLTEDYNGGANRSNRNKEDPSAIRWPRLYNDLRFDTLKLFKELLKKNIDYMLTHRELSDYISKKLPILGEYNRGGYNRRYLMTIGSFLEEQKQCDSSPPSIEVGESGNDESLGESIPKMTMEKILSETPINNENIFLLDFYDFYELKELVRAINEETIDLDVLMSAAASDSEQIGKTQFLNFIVFFKDTSPFSEDIKESAELLEYLNAFSEQIIQGYEELLFDKKLSLQEKNLKKAEYFNDLKNFLNDSHNGFTFLCNYIWTNHKYLCGSRDKAASEVKKLLFVNDLWSTSLSHDEIYDSIDPYDLEELKWLVNSIHDKTIEISNVLLAIKQKIQDDSCFYNPSIEDFLVLTSFLFLTDGPGLAHNQKLVKEYSEILFNHLIFSFTELASAPIEQFSEEEKNLQKKRFLENLALILNANPNQSVPALCDLILNRENTPTPRITELTELKHFLQENQIWNPTPLEDLEEKSPSFNPDWDFSDVEQG